MGNVVNVRVEAKTFKGDFYDRDKAFKIMFNDFKRKVSDAGIMTDYKNHQTYESKSRKDRQKRREIVARMQMEDLEQKIKAGKPVEKNNKLYKKYMQKQRSKKKEDNF